MTSAKSYAKAYLAASTSLPAEQRIGWLMVLNGRRAQRTLSSIVQHPNAQQELDALGAPKEVSSFLIVLHDDRALRHLGAIAEQGLRLAYEQQIASPATVQTASGLDEAQSKVLLDVLEAQLPNPVIVQTLVDPSLLGGLSLQIGGKRIDKSVRGAFGALAQAMKP